MTHIKIGGETFEVRVEGDATRPSLLLSNSLGTDLSLWDGQMAALLEHFRVIRYDTCGHGGSAQGAGPISIARLGRDVLAILDALEIRTTHVVGLSMGGAIAQWLLAHAPDRIDRAVLANTAALFGPPEAWNTRIATVLTDGMDAVADRTIERWFGATFRAANPERVAAVHDGLRTISPTSYAACCAALRDMDLRESSRGIDRPVLVVTGHEDPVIAESDTAILLSAIEGARHVELDARHLSNIEAEAAFNNAVIAFLTAKIPTRKASARTQAPRKARKTATRSSPARSPLKTVAVKPAKSKPATAKASAKTPVPSRRTLANKLVTTKAGSPKTATKAIKKQGAGATAAAKPTSKRRVAPKPPAKVKAARKMAVKKTTVKKATPARRATPINARGAIKKAATKAKSSGKAVGKKAVVKKIAAKKTPPKKTITKKTVSKKARVLAKAMPAPRRKPGRPTARRRK